MYLDDFNHFWQFQRVSISQALQENNTIVFFFLQKILNTAKWIKSQQIFEKNARCIPTAKNVFHEKSQRNDDFQKRLPKRFLVKILGFAAFYLLKKGTRRWFFSAGTNYANIVNKDKQEVYTQNKFHNINTNNSTLAEWCNRFISLDKKLELRYPLCAFLFTPYCSLTM